MIAKGLGEHERRSSFRTILLWVNDPILTLGLSYATAKAVSFKTNIPDCDISQGETTT